MEIASIFEKMAGKRKVKQGQKAWKYLRDLSSQDVRELNRLAIVDGSREYTYGLMFREWERYASVFTALDMTEAQNTRVGILGSTCAEVIFSVYGLNMVGAQVSLVASYSAFNSTRIKETIRQEKLTDFILTDDLAQQDLVRELLLKRKELGLRHVILLHVPISGPAAIPVLTAAQESKYAFLKTLYQPICMDTLLASFGSHPVQYALQETDETAFILHTTGTTSGTGKPVPMSDSAMNAAVARFMKLKDLSLPYDHLVSAMMVDLSNSYGIIDQVHLPLAMGATVAAVPAGLLNPWFYKAISAYRVSFLFSVNSMFERWMKLPEDTDFDFSSLKFVALGGTSVSASDKKRYHAFIEAHGGKDVTILNGYGLSEMGGACCLSPPDLDDESIGYPMPGITIRLYDEDEERFFSPRREVSEGVLYMNALSMATPQLDGKDVVKFEMIDRLPYVCTNDLVRVDKDGKMTYLGRANRYFMRDEGKKYEFGRVETEFSRLEDIESCAIVPVFVKLRHDNIPMLCVKTLEQAGEPEKVILKALRQVFIDKKILPEEGIPCRVMLVDMLPRNLNGKIDLYQLNRGEVSGDMYTVEELRTKGQLTDFRLIPCQEGPSDVIEQIFDDMSADIKSKLRTKSFIRNIKKEAPIMENYGNKVFESFNTMCNMHLQMMNNMFGRMGQKFPWMNQVEAFCQTPEMKSMMEMMPNMQGMVPEMQKVAQTMQGMMPNIPFMMKNMAQAMLPVIHQQTAQMLSNMNQLNQMTFETIQRLHEQKCELNEKWFELAMKMVSTEPEKEGAEAEAAEPETEAVEPEIEIVETEE